MYFQTRQNYILERIRLSISMRNCQNMEKNVQLVYGRGSIRKNGIYHKVAAILKANGKNIVEDGGVMPNPTVEKLYQGCRIAKEGNVDLILAVGGGSCCDYAKAVSVSAHCKEDPWKKYYLDFEDVDPDTKIIPVGCVLTMAGTGSEMNGGAVITNHGSRLKIGHVFGDRVFPKFSILNPVFTYSLPRYQMAAGFYDILNHICEQYFSGEDDNTSDYLMEGLMRSLIHSSLIAIKNPEDYEARSNIMWTATWALNTLVAMGKSTDWMVHMLGQSVGAYTNATHLLPPYHALWAGKVQTVCGKCMECGSGRKDSQGSGGRRLTCNGTLDGRNRCCHEYQGTWRDRRDACGVGGEYPHHGGRL